MEAVEKHANSVCVVSVLGTRLVVDTTIAAGGHPDLHHDRASSQHIQRAYECILSDGYHSHSTCLGLSERLKQLRIIPSRYETGDGSCEGSVWQAGPAWAMATERLHSIA